MSYPLVFQYNGEYYMIPETADRNEVQIYRATAFPYSWSYLTTIVSGPLRDSTIFRYNNIWWMFSSGPSSVGDCYLFYSDELTTGWVEHPLSPIVSNDASKARPAGRPIVFDNGRIIRFAQKGDVGYGEQVRAFEVDVLTKTDYAEHEIPESPILEASGTGWNRTGMHHLDPWWNGNHWLSVVDGNSGNDAWSIGLKVSYPETLCDNEVDDYEIFYYDGATTTQVTDNSYDDGGPKINANGNVVWAGYDGSDSEVFLACPMTPDITSPVPGSTLSGSSETFSWTANGTAVNEWYLWAGSCNSDVYGGCGQDYYNSGSMGGGVSSSTATGLPTDGSTVYVRLWYLISGGLWESFVFQYTAYTDVGGGTPDITSPVPYSTLSGSSETFNWTDNGTSVTNWWLWAGTVQ